jgi:hypothetical protein
MHRETSSRGWLRYGNPPGDPTTAPRCGAVTRAGTACQAPAMRAKRRCRMHGGRSTGPRTLAGLARLRAAATRHGRCSAVGRAFERWRRQSVANGYRSARAMADPRARTFFLQRAAEPLPTTLLAAMRQEAGDAVARQDAERLQAIARRRFRPRRERRLNSERLGRTRCQSRNQSWRVSGRW